MKVDHLTGNNIITAKKAKNALKEMLMEFLADKRQVVVLTDTNTKIHCLPVLHRMTENILTKTPVITIPSGEQFKTLETAAFVFKELAALNIQRNGILINLGGGVITDLGGFVASTYKRGIDTIHIPTTLMGMADAAIGGKTAVDIESIKNLTGTFYIPRAVYIFPEFLKTLPDREILQAHAEVLKYGFIHSPQLLEVLPVNPENFEHIISLCSSIKQEITETDPLEKGVRKLLNFGHTVGHAFESLALSRQQSLLHGEAIASGMACELFLSHKLTGLNKKELDNYIKTRFIHFPKLHIGTEDYPLLMQFMSNDKKNMNDQIMFTLVQSPGNAVYNMSVSQEDVVECFDYYRSVSN